MKKTWIVLMVMAGFIVLTGLQPAAYGAGKNKIHFGYLVADQIHNFASMLMKEKKFLEAEGIEVKWGEYLAGAYLMQHLAAGEVDFGTCGCVPTMITRGQGVNVVILAGSNTEGSAIIVKHDIKTPKDLDGKSIGTPGIGSIQDAMVDMVARKHNITIKKRHMSVPDMPIFLQKGEIDGFIAWAPHNEKAEALGYGRIILTSADILPGHQCCVLVAQGKLLKEEPELVRKVIRAYMKAFQYEQKNHEENIDLVVKYTNAPKDVVKKAWGHTPHPYPPYVSVESLKMQADGLIKGGKIQKDKVKDLDKFVADLYHPKFIKEYMEKSK
ncbi:MAG: ABC transporter substrate-binding protein [Thermodesulfobacteriota bacterium]